MATATRWTRCDTSRPKILGRTEELWFDGETQDLAAALKRHTYFHSLLGTLDGAAKAWETLVGGGEGQEFREYLLTGFLANCPRRGLRGRRDPVRLWKPGFNCGCASSAEWSARCRENPS